MRKTLEEKTKKELVKILDRVFSEYVRLEAADGNGYCFCFTSGACRHWKDIDCGHFISRAREAVRWEPMNCKPQSRRDNRFRQGEHDIFRQRLAGEYGKEAVEALELKARSGGGFDAYQLKEMIALYREKVKVLKKEKGL